MGKGVCCSKGTPANGGKKQFPKAAAFGAAMFACSRQLTSKLAISACRNLFSFTISLFSNKEMASPIGTDQRAQSAQYDRP
jgi:hypothetical protein